jgi:hypothetical protein
MRRLFGAPVVPLDAAPGVVAGVVAGGGVGGSDAVAWRGATAGSVSFDVIHVSFGSALEVGVGRPCAASPPFLSQS